MKNLNDVINGVDEVLGSAKQGNFEDILAKTKSYAAMATKKSAERLEISRKKIELFDAKTKLSKAYEKYGRLMYASVVGESVSDDERSSVIAEIQLQKTRAEFLENEINALKAVFRKAQEEPAGEEPAVETVVVEPQDE